MGFIPPAIWVMLAACMYGSLVNTSMLLNDSKGSGEQSTFSPARSPGFLNICGRTLHHLHCSEHRAGGGGGERECSHREIVALAAMLSSDLPLCYQFQIQMQNSSLWNLTFPPPLLCLSFFFLSRLGFPSFALPLAFPSHPVLLSSRFFNFRTLWSQCQPREPPNSPPPSWRVNSGTPYLFFPPLYISPYCVINPPPLSPSPPPTWSCLSRSISFSTGCIVLAWKTGFWTGVK